MFRNNIYFETLHLCNMLDCGHANTQSRIKVQIPATKAGIGSSTLRPWWGYGMDFLVGFIENVIWIEVMISVIQTVSCMSAHADTNQLKQTENSCRPSTPHRLLTNKGETCQPWITKQITWRKLKETKSQRRAERKPTDITITVCQLLSDWKE